MEGSTLPGNGSESEIPIGISETPIGLMCPYLNWLRYRFASGMILFVLALVCGVMYVFLNNWVCRTGFIGMASTICVFSTIIMASASVHADLSFVLSTTIIIIIFR